MKYTKRPSSISDRIKVREKLKTLESYLMSCDHHCEKYEFDDAHEAYEFGQKLREIAMHEEGVNHADQMQKFEVDISYTTVRIKLLIGELASR